MRDKELTYWTCRGVKAAGNITIYTVQLYKCLSYCDLSGFYVATIDEEVVGTISYLKEVSCVLLSTLVISTPVFRLKMSWRSSGYPQTRSTERLGWHPS